MGYPFLSDGGGGHSFIVSGAFFESDARSIELVIVALCALFAAWAAATFIAMAISYAMKNVGTPRKLRDKIERRSPLISRLKNRRDYLIQQAETANDHVKNLQKARSNFKQKVSKLANAKDILVRQSGEDLVGTNCYNFVVANRYVLNYAAKGQKHPLLDDSWKIGQLVEVWASSMLEARVAIVERYPATQGFFVAESGRNNAQTLDTDTQQREPT